MFTAINTMVVERCSSVSEYSDPLVHGDGGGG